MKIIEIIINPIGEATVQTKGFTGTACRDASKAIEKALGLVQSDRATAEMYQAQPVDESVRQGNG